MVAHWRRSDAPGAKRSLVINACGAFATGATLIVIAVSKFEEGAWITVLVIPPLIWLFWRIRRYHDEVGRETDVGGPLDMSEPILPPVIVIPLKRMDRVARKALRFALTLSNEIRAVQIIAEEMKTEDLSATWDTLVEEPVRATGRTPPYLTVVRSSYGEFFTPLLTSLKKVGAEFPDRTVAVMIPEIVERRWYHFLFRHRTTVLKGLLLLRGGPRIAIITTPWYVNDAMGEQQLATAAPGVKRPVARVIAPSEAP